MNLFIYGFRAPKKPNAKATRTSATLVLVLVSTNAIAGIGGAGTNFGLGPISTGTAMAYSSQLNNPLSVYYNPASLARSNMTEIMLFSHYGDTELRARSQGGAAPAKREGSVLSDGSSEMLVIGMTTPIMKNGMKNPGAVFGINLGVDEYTKNFLPYNASTSEVGQFVRYESEPLYIGLAVAVPDVISGLDVGIGTRLTLDATASLNASSDLGGNTDSEELGMKASPNFSMNMGVNVDFDELFCGSTKCEKLAAYQAAIFWRDESSWNVAVNANLVVPGVIPQPGLDVILNTIDSFQPEVLGGSLTIQTTENLQAILSIEKQIWSSLTDAFKNDSVRDQANLKFQDTLVPRLGVRYQIYKDFFAYSGISYEESPLKGRQSVDVNYFDADKMSYGMGLEHQSRNALGPDTSVIVGAGIQYQQLEKREFELININSPTYPAPYETVIADGEATVVSASLSILF